LIVWVGWFRLYYAFIESGKSGEMVQIADLG
jgi:hypothetical protein